jgi:hypothetical protein
LGFSDAIQLKAAEDKQQQQRQQQQQPQPTVFGKLSEATDLK